MGAGFTGILALLGVGCSLATSRLRVVSAGVAGAAAIAAWALPLKLNIVVAIAAAVAICLVIESYGPRWLRGQPMPLMPEFDPWTLLVIAALAVVTVVTRGFSSFPNATGPCHAGPSAACSMPPSPHWRRWWCRR